MSVNRSLYRTFLYGIAISCVIFALFVQFDTAVFAANGINRQINYQAKLTDTNGFTVADGDYAFKFSIYDSATGGNLLWTSKGTLSTPSSVTTTLRNGLFTILLGDTSVAGGSQNALDDSIDWNSDSLYLGVTVSSDGEMSPRKRLGAVPQAFNAEKLQGMHASGTAFGANSVFIVNQTSNTAASGTRSALEIRSSGTSDANDFLIRGVNDIGSTVFSVNRQGNVTTTNVNATGLLNVLGNTTLGDTTSDLISANGRFVTDLVPNADLTYSLGTSTNRWNGYFANVTSTNVTTTNLSTANLSVTNSINNILGTGSTFLLKSSTAVGTQPKGMFISGRYAYVANKTSGNLQILDVTNPSAPVSITTVALGSNPEQVYVSGRYAYVTVRGSSLFSIVDVSDPKNAHVVGTLSGLSSIHGVFVSGRYAYVTQDIFAGGTLLVIDVSDPSNPKLISENQSFSNPMNVYVNGKYAYIPNYGDATFKVVDISNPTKTVIVGSTSVGVNPIWTVVQGGYAYVADFSTSTFSVIRVTDATAPTVVGTVDIGANAKEESMAVSGRYAYILADDGKIHVVDVQDPTVPVQLFAFSLAGVNNNGIFVNGRYLYLNNSTGATFNIYDITGIETNGFIAHTAELGSLQVRANGQIANQLTVGGGLTVGRGGILTDGALTVAATNTTSSIYGNLLVGTSTYSVSLNAAFAINGDDFYVSGNMGSVSSVYTNGAFIAGPGSTYYGDGFINKNNGNLILNASGGFITPTTDLSVSLGSETLRYNGIFGSTTSTNATTTNFYATNATIANFITTGISSANLSWTNATGTNTTSTNLFAANGNVTTLNFGSATGATLFATSGTIATFNTTDLNASNLLFTNATGTNATTSFLAVTGPATSTFNGSIQSLGNVSSTNLFASSFLNVFGNVILGDASTDLISANGSFNTNLVPNADGTLSLGSIANRWNAYFGNVTSTNATTTNFYATNGTIANFTTTGLNSSNLTWVNATGTNTTSTNLFAANGNITTLNFGSATGATLSATSGTIATLNATNLTGSSLLFTNATGTSLSVDRLTNIIQNGTVPPRVGTLTFGSSSNNNNIVISGRYAYIANRNGTLNVVDVTNPSAPYQVATSTINATAELYGVYVAGRYAYLTDRGNGSLVIYDVSNPALPMQMSTTTIGGTVSDVSVSGKYAYLVSDTANKFVVVDVSNPASPSVVSTYNTNPSGNPHALYVAGRYAYVTNSGNDTVLILDVSDPEHPLLASTITLTAGSIPTGVFVSGRYAYIANLGNDTMATYDISNAASAQQVATTTIVSGSDPSSVFAAGRYVFVTGSGNHSLNVIDVAVPASPTQVATTTFANGSADAFISGRYAYVTNGNNLAVVDLGGTEISALLAHSVELGSLQVQTNGLIGNQLTVGGGLVVGNGGILTSGPLSVSAINATSSILGNLTVGTSSYMGTPLNTAFVMDGNDFFVQGNIGAATSVYTNGAFIAGSGSTFFGDGFINKNNGNLILNASGGFITPTTDLSVSLGSETLRYNGIFGSTTSTNATTTNFYATNATIANFITTGISSSNLTWTNATGTNTTSTNLSATSAVITDLRFTTASGTNATTSFFAVTGPATSTFNGSVQSLGNVSSTNLFASSFLNVFGNVILGDASTDLISANGSFNTNLLPNADGTLSLGSIANRWNAYFGNVTSTNATTTNFYATNGTIANLIATDISTSNLTWTNATGTNVTTTNLYTTNFSTQSVSTTNLTWNNATGTNLSIGQKLDASFNANVSDAILTSTYTNELNHPRAMEIQGNKLYVIDHRYNLGTSSTLNIIDISNPASPSTTVAIPGIGFTDSNTSYALQVTGRYAYVLINNTIGLSRSELKILDISDPYNATSVGSILMLSPHGSATDFTVVGHYAYVTYGNSFSGFSIYDVADPLHPIAMGSTGFATGFSRPVQSVAVSGKYAYVTTQGGGDNNVWVVDISDANNPTVVGQTGDLGISANAIRIQGRYAFVDGSSNNLAVVDIANPARPYLITTLTVSGSVSGNAHAFEIAGRYLYKTGFQGFAVIDIANPLAPSVVITKVPPLSNEVQGLAISGSSLFVGPTSAGAILTYTLPTIETGTLNAGTARVGTLQVTGDGKIERRLTIGQSLDVGRGGITVDGDFIGTATNTTSSFMGNLTVGTSTYGTRLNTMFALDGNDFFVQGNIGSVSSVYTNGAFVAGTGTTMFGDGFISKTNGNLIVNASGGFITPTTDLSVSLGSETLRYNGIFGNTTTTNATTTNLFATNGTITNFTTTGLSSTNLTWTNATGTNTTSTNLAVTGYSSTTQINASVGYYYGGTGSPMNLELTRVSPTTTGATVDIGSFFLLNGAHNIRVTLTDTEESTATSLAKTYFISSFYDGTAGVWEVVPPYVDTGAYNSQDMALDVRGTTHTLALRIRRVSGSSTGTIRVRIESMGQTNDVFTPSTAAGFATAPTAMYEPFFQSSGSDNVGIGTMAPSTKLDVYGTVSSTGLNVNGNATTTRNLFAAYGTFTEATTTNLRVGSNATVGGFLGVNTKVPSSTLEVVSNGGANTGINLRLMSAASYAPIDFSTASALAAQFLFTGTSFSQSGTFGPNELTLANETAAGGVQLAAIGASGFIKFSTGSNSLAAERMRILANGNVGIGTTTPSTTLEVIGTVSSTNIFATSGVTSTSLTVTGVATSTFSGSVQAISNVSTTRLTASGFLNVYGNVTLGDASTTDTITANGRFNTNLIPATNNLYDLGSAANSWRDTYSSGTIYAVNMVLTGTSTAGQYSFQDDAGAVTAMDMNVTTAAGSEVAMSYEFDIDGNPFLQMYSRADGAGGLQTTSTAVRFFQPLLPSGNNSIDIGAAGTNAIRSLYASSTIFAGGGVTSTGNITPFINNTYDLGAPGYAWQNVYASGTIFGANMSVSGTATFANLLWTNATGTNVTTTNLAVSGRVNSDLIPTTNNTYDLGSPSNSWNDIYASGTIYGVNTNFTGTSTAGQFMFQDDANAVTAMDMNVTTAAASEQQMSYDFNIDGNPFLQIYSRADGAGGLQSTSTAVRFFQPLLPAGNNSIDIGANGTNAIRSLYASSTIFAGGGVSSTGNVNPSANNTYNLGGPGAAWANIYTSGTIFGAGIASSGTSSFADLTWVNATGTNTTSTFLSVTGVASTTVMHSKTFLADNGTATAPSFSFFGETNTGIYNPGGAVRIVAGGGTVCSFSSGSANCGGTVVNTGDIRPNAQNNTYDVGNSTAAYKNIYASGTLFGANADFTGGVTSTNATTTFLSVTGLASTTQLRVIGGGTATPLTVTGGTIGGTFTSAGGASVTLADGSAGLYGLKTNNALFAASGMTVNSGGGITSITGPIDFYPAQSLAVRFVADGSVGIGVVTPGAKLDVLGVVSSSGMIVNGGVTSTNATTTQNLFVGKSITQKLASSTIDLISTTSSGSSLSDIAITGKRALLARQVGGSVDVLDISNLGSVSLLKRLNDASFSLVSGIVAQGDYAYTVQNAGGGKLTVIDLRNGANAVARGTVTLDQAKSLFVNGQYAYVPGYTDNKLHVVEIAVADTPFTVSSNVLFNGAVDLYVQGRYAYVTNQGDNTLKIIDISNPANPLLVSSLGGFFTPDGITVNGKYAYLVNALGNSLNVIDVSDPTAAVVVASSTVLTTPHDVTLSGKYLYISNTNAANTLVYDVSSSTNPVLVNTVDVGGQPYQARVVGRNLYAIDTFNGNLKIYSLPGVDVPSLRVDSGEIGQLTVMQDGSIGGNLDVRGAVTIGDQGLKVTGPSSLVSSSTFPGLIVANTVASNNLGTNWGAYIDRLLIGENVMSTGTADFYQVITYSGNIRAGLCVDNTSTAATCLPSAGVSIQADGAVNSNAFDLAERYLFTGPVSSTEVLVLDSAASSTVKTSTGIPYDPNVIGIASTNPAFIMGTLSSGFTSVAITGHVPTKVSTVNGAIAIGDPLTTSQYPGVAMKATKPGTIIGFALESAQSTSTIEVFVKVGYDARSALSVDATGSVSQFNDNLVFSATSTASSTNPNVDSWGLTFRGSSWDGVAPVNVDFTLSTDIINATTTRFSIKNASSTSLFSVDQTGTARVTNDLILGGKLYPSARGVAQTDKYIFLDNTDPSSTYMATNADGWQANTSYDYAERYYSPDALQPGDLVSASERGRLHVQRSMDEIQPLLGIVSTKPGFVAGARATSTFPIALAGRVPTKISTLKGAIKTGDPLAPSTIPGVAVKATVPGPIVGYALEGFDSPEIGMIEVFVNPGWWGTNAPATTVSAPIVTATPTSMPAAETSPYSGYALIAAGSKEVHVSYPSLHSYPNVQATPRGEVDGGWWTDHYTDVGFDIIIKLAQSHDVSFAWHVAPTTDGQTLYFSDGTTATMNSMTGEPTVQPVPPPTDTTTVTSPPPATTDTTAVTAPTPTTTTTTADPTATAPPPDPIPTPPVPADTSTTTTGTAP